MGEKLKECPFCGGEAIMSYAVGTGERKRTIGCMNDDCLNPRWWKDESEINEEDFIKAWNTRSNPTEVSELQKEVSRLTMLKDGQKEFVEHWGRVIIAFEKQFPREFHLAKRYAEDDFKKIEQALTTNGTKHE